MLAYSGLLSRYWVRSSRPCAFIDSRNRLERLVAA